ncbi:methyltransferase [Actinomadura fibrosa]|uniref:Methyltransferase n=1 Tax=Actinomadura fibrosa TaxID=111802 RepID=A0ABW2Y1S0_9ACTN|nr:methyltransferase [Actinomadura fibrosa]
MPDDPAAKADIPDPIMIMLTGGLFTHVGYALARLGVADEMSDAPSDVTSLAEKVSAHPDALLQLLRTGVYLGVFTESPGRHFALTAAGRQLREDAPQSRKASLIRSVERNGPIMSEIMHTVRTGLPAYEKVHGTPFFNRPEDKYQLHIGGSPHVREMMSRYGFPAEGTVVDVAGGYGYVLTGILRDHPALRGVLFDQPHAIKLAEELIDEDVADRCELVGGSFFDSIPTGGDVYLVTRTLHNWSDEATLTVLKNIRAAMPDSARLLVAERLMEPDFRRRAAMTVYLDFYMLLLNGGRERTEEEYRDLLERSGFRVSGVHPSTAPPETPAEGLLEAVPV